MGALDGIVTFEQNEYRICKVEGKKALFHRWNEHCDVVEPSPMIGGTPGGQIKYITGIVEFEDGSIKEVYPAKITFKDNKLKEFVCIEEKTKDFAGNGLGGHEK